MPKPVTFDIHFTGDGEAKIMLPEGPNQQKDASLVSKFTEQLAKLMGGITERHIGKHHEKLPGVTNTVNTKE